MNFFFTLCGITLFVVVKLLFGIVGIFRKH